MRLVHAAARRAHASELNGQEKHLAVHASELVVKPDLQILRRYRRPLLIRLENIDRLILGDHVRSAQQC